MKRTAQAPGGRFSVISDPKAKKVEVYTAGPNPQVLWSFDYDVQLDEFVVSDDGENVAIIWWPPNPVKKDGKDIALRFWNRNKGEFKTFELGEICGQFPNVGGVERGFLSTRKPVPWAEQPRCGSDNILRLRTIDSHECDFSMTTGNMLRREWFLSDGNRFLLDLLVKLGILCLIVGAIIAGVILVIWFIAWESTRHSRTRIDYRAGPSRSR
ncbi:MAG: hypothetical protein HYX68_28940 [Planctomycetes bacterium]|nr:hypothetical protein [Planctomycetota bacterium]